MAQRLHSLDVEGFKALNQLSIPRLGDINLIVGKNSSGKTTVLEAIRLLLTKDVRPRIYSLLADRDEYSTKRWLAASRLNSPQSLELAFEALFSGRPELSSEPSIQIAGNSDEIALSLEFVWLRREVGEDASVSYARSGGPSFDVDAIPGFRASNNSATTLVPLDRINRLATRRALRENFDTGPVFLSSSGMSMEEVGQIWDGVALTDDEDHVIEALRIIAPTLEKLVLVQSPDARSDRMLMAKLREFRAAIPFRSLGEGAMHLLNIALGAIQARGSTLLIDEIAAGIHYSVQPKVWELISKQSEIYDMQVFATTHSWDCVRALHHIGGSPSRPEPALHRLERLRGLVRAVSFFDDELAIVDAEEIEVR